MSKADDQEVLIINADEKVQRGLAQLLSGAGLVPTVLSDPARAHTLLKEKYFPVVVVDLDTPQLNAGLELVRWLKQEMPAIAVFVLAARKVFEVAVKTYRASAYDMVMKSPNQIEYLKRRII